MIVGFVRALNVPIVLDGSDLLHLKFLSCSANSFTPLVLRLGHIVLQCCRCACALSCCFYGPWAPAVISLQPCLCLHLFLFLIESLVCVQDMINLSLLDAVDGLFYQSPWDCALQGKALTDLGHPGSKSLKEYSAATVPQQCEFPQRKKSVMCIMDKLHERNIHKRKTIHRKSTLPI